MGNLAHRVWQNLPYIIFFLSVIASVSIRFSNYTTINGDQEKHIPKAFRRIARKLYDMTPFGDRIVFRFDLYTILQSMLVIPSIFLVAVTLVIPLGAYVLILFSLSIAILIIRDARKRGEKIKKIIGEKMTKLSELTIRSILMYSVTDFVFVPLYLAYVAGLTENNSGSELVGGFSVMFFFMLPIYLFFIHGTRHSGALIDKSEECGERVGGEAS